MPEYFLPPHVHFCSHADSLVFMDLRRDDYILMSGDDAANACALFEAGSTGTAPTPTYAFEELLRSGVLTTDSALGRRVVRTEYPLALEPLLDDQVPVNTRVSATQIWRFIAACIKAAFWLWRLPTEHMVRKVATRKKNCADSDVVDIARARDLTAVFLRLRWLFPRNYLCLYDSLALLEFLAQFGIYPSWVFGVRLTPWAAHCWVQDRRFTYNEEVEKAASFTPILAI